MWDALSPQRKLNTMQPLISVSNTYKHRQLWFQCSEKYSLTCGLVQHLICFFCLSRLIYHYTYSLVFKVYFHWKDHMFSWSVLFLLFSFCDTVTTNSFYFCVNVFVFEMSLKNMLTTVIFLFPPGGWMQVIKERQGVHAAVYGDNHTKVAEKWMS